MTRSTVDDRNTRNKDYLNIPAYQSTAGQRTFLYRTINLWNSLPRAITAVDSLRIFKEKLREFLFESFLVSWRSYLSMFLSITIILSFRCFIQYFKLTLWTIYLLMYVGSEKPWFGDSIKFSLYFYFNSALYYLNAWNRPTDEREIKMRYIRDIWDLILKGDKVIFVSATYCNDVLSRWGDVLRQFWKKCDELEFMKMNMTASRWGYKQSKPIVFC